MGSGSGDRRVGRKVPDSHPTGLYGYSGVDRGWVYTVVIRYLDRTGRVTSVMVVVPVDGIVTTALTGEV